MREEQLSVNGAVRVLTVPMGLAMLPTHICYLAGHPSYDHYYSRRTDVYLNGLIVQWQVEANVEEGWVIKYETDDEGSFVYDSLGNANMIKMFGNVKIKFRGRQAKEPLL